MSIKHVFGIENNLRNSIYYLDEHCYLYLSSRHIIFYNIDYKYQRLIPYGNQFDKLKLISISRNKEYLGIVLNTLDKCRIIIYDINNTIRRRKIISLKKSIRSIDILSIVFSNNSKYLLILYGAPDYILVCWSIDRWKCDDLISLHIDLSNNPLNLQISFNPIDSSEFVITGNHIYRQYHLNNGHFSTYGQGQFKRYESLNITCHCWLNENHILIGLNTGFIYTINKNGDITQRYNIIKAGQSNDLLYNSSNFQSISDRNILKRKNSSESFYDNNSNDIICLLSFSRGVFVSIGTGCVLMYERNENCVELTYLRRLILPSSNEIVQSLALSPNEETLLVATNTNHLYEFAFSKIDYTKKEVNMFTHALDTAHIGSIRTGGVCIHKSILFTLGIDRCLKIWNLQTNNQELNHQFIDEPLSISIHPTGIFICITFSNIVRIYGYTIDGLIVVKELEISNIQAIEYSHDGHILAIVYDNILQLHYHNDYDQTMFGRASEKKFRLIRWTHDDASIISIDCNNLVIRWDPYTGQRLSEYQIIDFNVQDLLISSDNKIAYLLSSDNKIKEFSLMTTIRDITIPFDACIPTALLINDEIRHLFIGSQNGSIYSIKLTQLNSLVDINTSHDTFQMNVHQGAITKILISFENDLIISLGEDGHIVTYNLNTYQPNKESKVTFRDEILAKEVLLKEQNIELNNLMKREFEIEREYENRIETKEEEYLEHLHQLDLHCQSHINTMENKLIELREQKSTLKNKHEQHINELIEEKQNSINDFAEEKSKHYKQIVLRNQLLESKIENFKLNKNEQTYSINNSYQQNIELIHLSYRDKLNNIKKKFFQEHSDINKRIDYLEEMKDVSDENNQIELTDLHTNYQTKLKIVLDKIEQLENEEVLLKTRFKQLEEESNHYENEIKQFENERNQFIDHIRQVDNDLNLAKQTIEQRNFIIQEKLKRTNQMETRRDELEKFAYVFNYKIRELTNQIDPRQHEIKALIEQFNNMDNEYDLLTKNNEKYLIKINDYKSRLRSIEKQLQYEIISTRKLNEITTNINEDFKLCSYLINQPNKLIKIINQIYSKYIQNIHTNINLRQNNLFDYDRQRIYFEKTNQRLKNKILIDFKKEKNEEIRKIKEQINIMREISSYSLKVLQLQQILSDLDIVSNIAINTNSTTSNQIIHQLKIKQNYNFIKQKQSEFNSILNKQQIRIEQLNYFITNLQQTYQLCQTKFYFTHQSNSSTHQSNSIYSQISK